MAINDDATVPALYSAAEARAHPIMQPYPAHLVQRVTLADGAPVTIRPIRPGDADIEQEFVRNLSKESRFFRFMDGTRELKPQMLARFTQVDYDAHMAFIAVTETSGREIEIAVARYVAAADSTRCEFAIVVADEWQRRGVGSLLMRKLISAARARGLRRMYGEVLAGNRRMLNFVRRLGFRPVADPGAPAVIRMEIQL